MTITLTVVVWVVVAVVAVGLFVVGVLLGAHRRAPRVPKMDMTNERRAMLLEEQRREQR